MKKIVFVFLALLCVSESFAQVCVIGKISNDTLKAPVANASIFIAELNKMTSSDASGLFRMCQLPKGTFALQVKCLGYKTYTSNVVLSDSVNTLTISLQLTSIEYPELVVYGDQVRVPLETANQISSISTSQMRENGALTLCDGITRLPGVSQLSTGAGISKPVIRGMYGNRIQTVVMGMRFDNQQWQDEHGLGLTDAGVDRIEIIKGPASLLYGSESMGGVLQIIDEKPAPAGLVVGDYSVRTFSNTYGIATDAGVKGSEEHYNWKVRAGVNTQADYSDGKGKRILNSRFADYNMRAGFGYTGRKWTSVNNYMYSKSNFGFLMEAFQLNLPPDGRLSRSFAMPHHTVFMNMLTSQNTIHLDESKVKLNFGAHLNSRQEQEGGSKISLDMNLNTFTGNLMWIRDLGEHTELNIGTQDMLQTNKNNGSRMIVPDAFIEESSLYSYLKHSRKYFFAEGGMRYDRRMVETHRTGDINNSGLNPGLQVVPFHNTFSALNGSAGISVFDTKHWSMKANLSSGYRSGNLAELSSNGVHEGTYRYEVGNINLKIEQNLNADASLSYDSKDITVTGSVYENHFKNYIYLAPTSEEYIGFQVYRYVQKDALLKGSEISSEFHPVNMEWLKWRTSIADIIGKTSDQEYLPYIPAKKLSNELKIMTGAKGKIKESFLRFSDDYVVAQSNPAQFETATAEYNLINIGAGLSIINKKNRMDISVSGNNLLNEAYYDHLSRYKSFGIYNMGRNVSVNFKMTFKGMKPKAFYDLIEDALSLI